MRDWDRDDKLQMGVFVALVLAGILLMNGCATVQKVRDESIGRAELAVGDAHQAVNMARSEFVKWNRAAEAAIVAGAATEADGLKALAVFDQARAPIVRAFVLAYTALAHAEAMLPLIRAKTVSLDSLLPILSRLVGPVSEINRRVAALR